MDENCRLFCKDNTLVLATLQIVFSYKIFGYILFFYVYFYTAIPIYIGCHRVIPIVVISLYWLWMFILQYRDLLCYNSYWFSLLCLTDKKKMYSLTHLPRWRQEKSSPLQETTSTTTEYEWTRCQWSRSVSHGLTLTPCSTEWWVERDDCWDHDWSYGRGMFVGILLIS